MPGIGLRSLFSHGGASWRLALLTVFLIKAVLLFVVLPYFGEALTPYYGVGFADDYDRLAHSLASGNGYRFEPDYAATLMREPGYPFFLAGLFKIFGYHIQAARLANFLLTIGIAALMFRLAPRIDTEKSVAFVAVLIFLIHPGVMVAESRGGVEILFMLLLMLFLLALYRAIERQGPRDYALAGALLGVVCLVRSTPLLFPLLVLGYLLVFPPPGSTRMRSVARIAVLLLCTGVVMSPWVIRNFMLVGEFVPTSSMLGVSMQSGQFTCEHLTLTRGFQELDATGVVPERANLARALGYQFKDDYYQYFYRTADEIAFNKMLLHRALERYRENPGVLAKCASLNLFNFWFAGKSWKATWLNVVIQLPLLCAALAGAWWLYRSGCRDRIAVPALFILYLLAVHLPIHAQARYSVPLVPLLAVLAAPAVVRAGSALARSEQAPRHAD